MDATTTNTDLFPFIFSPSIRSFAVTRDVFLARMRENSENEEHAIGIVVGALVFVPRAVFPNSPSSIDLCVSTTGKVELRKDTKEENEDDAILLLRRSASDTMPLRWEIPGGTVDTQDPSLLHGLTRELYEEAGLRATKVIDVVRPYISTISPLPFAATLPNAENTRAARGENEEENKDGEVMLKLESHASINLAIKPDYGDQFVSMHEGNYSNNTNPETLLIPTKIETYANKEESENRKAPMSIPRPILTSSDNLGDIFTSHGRRVIKYSFEVEVESQGQTQEHKGQEHETQEKIKEHTKLRGQEQENENWATETAVLVLPQVTLDPAEHDDYVWATQLEVERGVAMRKREKQSQYDREERKGDKQEEIVLKFTSKRQKDTILEGFRMREARRRAHRSQ